MNQKEFVSIDDKRALDQLYDYYESGFKTPFPQYFRRGYSWYKCNAT